MGTVLHAHTYIVPGRVSQGCRHKASWVTTKREKGKREEDRKEGRRKGRRRRREEGGRGEGGRGEGGRRT